MVFPQGVSQSCQRRLTRTASELRRLQLVDEKGFQKKVNDMETEVLREISRGRLARDVLKVFNLKVGQCTGRGSLEHHAEFVVRFFVSVPTSMLYEWARQDKQATDTATTKSLLDACEKEGLRAEAIFLRSVPIADLPRLTDDNKIGPEQASRIAKFIKDQQAKRN